MSSRTRVLAAALMLLCIAMAAASFAPASIVVGKQQTAGKPYQFNSMEEAATAVKKSEATARRNNESLQLNPALVDCSYLPADKASKLLGTQLHPIGMVNRDALDTSIVPSESKFCKLSSGSDTYGHATETHLVIAVTPVGRWSNPRAVFQSYWDYRGRYDRTSVYGIEDIVPGHYGYDDLLEGFFLREGLHGPVVQYTALSKYGMVTIAQQGVSSADHMGTLNTLTESALPNLKKEFENMPHK
jgi:hypothetical protein